MKLALIAAVGKNGELGWKGDMPWGHSLKEDLRFFKKTTLHHPVLIGRKTLESLPGLLPGRENIVLTSSHLPEREHLHVYDSYEAFEKDWKDQDQTVFVIGGASLYSRLLPDCDLLYLTEIDADYPADTWFPEFDHSKYDREVLDSIDENGIHYDHVLYRKKTSSF